MEPYFENRLLIQKLIIPIAMVWTLLATSSLAANEQEKLSEKYINDQCLKMAKAKVESQKLCKFIFRRWDSGRIRRHELADELYKCQYELITKTKPKAEQEKLLKEQLLKMAKEKIVEP